MTTSKSGPKSGGFQSMNLDKYVIRGIYRKGYKIPTPIQRKAIPSILDGRDVVAMARTGSGKTAAFLIPIVQRLKCHKAQTGARALILSPTRELAIQTYKFARDFTKFTDLKCEAVLGGDSLEKQFAKIHENPDIIIATPGRLLHLAIEMNLRFSSIEQVVFDEADRLFELGFKEQLNELLSRLPSNRQTLLFSATLPQMIVDFTKAGLNSPVLVRLDTENKISENLKTIYLSCRKEDKLAVLIYLLKFVIKPREQTVVFLPTRHHIEYVNEIFNHLSITCTYLYSSLDSEARKLNIGSFQSKKVNVLLVTDLAARGVDIPLLDNVINYNFPSKAKMFVHRVGRTARAGNSGTAYSLVAHDEMPFLCSLNLFLSKPLVFADLKSEDHKEVADNVFGLVPQMVIDEENETIDKLHIQFSELDSMKKVCNSAYMQYLKSRDNADSESVRNAKKLLGGQIGMHPIFGANRNVEVENERNEMLNSIKSYKPNTTIFELGKTKGSAGFEAMKQKRKVTDKLMRKGNKSTVDRVDEVESFDSNIGQYKANNFYVKYKSDDYHSEKGLQLGNSFDVQLKDAILDVTGDEQGKISRTKNQLKWDRKKKKFIQAGADEAKLKKIKTESGNWISASYKSGIYAKWRQKSKIEHQSGQDDEEMAEVESARKERDRKIDSSRRQKPKRKPKAELKSKEQIFKERQRLEKIQTYQKKKHAERQQKQKRKEKKKK